MRSCSARRPCRDAGGASQRPHVPIGNNAFDQTVVPLKARRVPTGRRATLVAAVVGTCLLPGAVAGESIGTVSGRVTLTTARGGKVATLPYGRRAVAPRPASAG